MLSFSTGFVKSVLSRSAMLGINPNRPAYAADLRLTRCPNPRRVRLTSKDAGHPAAAGYEPRYGYFGCRSSDCEACELDSAVGRVIKWSQNIKAFCAYEVDVMGSDLSFCSLTFPAHPDGDADREGAPDEPMVQFAWERNRRNLANFYIRHGCKMRDACSYVGMVEEGSQFGRLHLHLIFAARPGFPHPFTEYERELLSTLDRYGKRQWLCGLGQVWRSTLDSLGYESLQNWYRDSVRSAAQIASYCCSKYVTKGFLSGKVYRVRASHQYVTFPDVPYAETVSVKNKTGYRLHEPTNRLVKSGFDALRAWWRDRRFDLQGQQYRRWVGFRVQINELTEENIREECKRLGKEYARIYAQSVSLRSSAGEYLPIESPVPENLTMALLQGLSRAMGRLSDKRRKMGEDAGLPYSLELKPTVIALSDRPVSHPAGADYLTVSHFHESISAFGSPERYDNPYELLDAHDRFNLCGVSHWFPFDEASHLNVRDTEAFEEIVGWNRATYARFNEIVLKVLTEFLPGYAWSYLMQGMPAPVNVVDEDRLRRVASGFSEIFPDSILHGMREPAWQKPLRTESVTESPIDDVVVSALRNCADWDAPSGWMLSEVTTPGRWGEDEDFELHRGQFEIVNRVSAAADSDLYDGSGIYCLPTSFGKSLCYQLPNLPDGITLVVSPLLSLMRDQVQGLHALDVNAGYLSSVHNKAAKQRWLEFLGAANYVSDGDRPPHHAILYVSPESFAVGYEPERMVARYLREGYLRVSHLVIDEAHCVSQWSSFRPAYRAIPQAVDTWYYRPRVTSLFSATISPRILSELRAGFGDLQFFALPIRRANLRLRRSPVGFYDFFSADWSSVKFPAVIYCGARARCEEVAAFLRAQEVDCAHYHARVGDPEPTKPLTREHNAIERQKVIDKERKRIETAFMRGDIDVLTATVAYGMGIDKSDIRTVIHDCFPDTLEDYVQQAGRAGRDGEPADCVLLSSPGLVDSPDMWRYFHTDGCLWRHIALHHGQPAEDCGACDGCTGVQDFLPVY